MMKTARITQIAGTVSAVSLLCMACSCGRQTGNTSDASAEEDGLDIEVTPSDATEEPVPFDVPDEPSDAPDVVDDVDVDSPEGESCPEGMVLILEHDICIDPFEASRPDATATSQGTATGPAQSVRGVIPWTMVSWNEAAEWLADCSPSGDQCLFTQSYYGAAAEHMICDLIIGKDLPLGQICQQISLYIIFMSSKQKVTLSQVAQQVTPLRLGSCQNQWNS